MAKRKQYILDKNFQLRTTFSVLSVVAVVSIIIISMISATVVYNNEKIGNIYQIEDSIFNIMQTSALSTGKISDKQVLTDKLLVRHTANLENIETIAEHNRYLLVALIIFIILQAILIYAVIIRITHRIAGPIHVISSYIRDLLNGEEPVLRPLRNKDELKGFYKLFCDLAAYIGKLKK